ncbi:hypothetical protein CEXT_298561 [Caerostris extrusa]|uniref:Uncharacterized protein n=1 Tax=Caerostris extrusa TaxID=172846 RepID=A0AAV4WKQ8_CAEEX|nr:hypothetical protein CEXT_298561 [Caerostris extrusa]
MGCVGRKYEEGVDRRTTGGTCISQWSVSLVRENLDQILGRPLVNTAKIKLPAFGKSQIKRLGTLKPRLESKMKFSDRYMNY